MQNEDINKAQTALDAVWKNIQAKAIDTAQIQSQNLCKEHPEFAPGWHALCDINLRLGKIPDAFNAIRKALALQPDIPEWELIEAKILYLLGDRSKARERALSLINQPNKSVLFWAELALLLNKLNLYQQSLAGYQQALNLQPNNPQVLFNLASLLRFLGNFEEAKHALDKLIALNPNDTEAWLLRSNLNKQTEQNNHIKELHSALDRPAPPLAKSQLYYALGKELEDLNLYTDAFDAFQQGASVRRQHMQYSLENDLQTLQHLAQVFDNDTVNQTNTGYDSTQPIFIVGLPRTGSTLVERIISSHSDVFSAGELNNFAIQMMQQIQQSGVAKPANKLELIGLSKSLDFQQLGQRYIQSTRPDTKDYARFIDKLPLNSLYVGLIRLALPKAKIIHVERNPLDTCFAIFKHIFTQGYPFSYDLDELCQYQIAHHHLMAHWKKVLPNHIHTISYEHLTSDFTAQTNALLDYCDLSRQKACFDFQHNAAPSTTASAAQVRQPVYSSSVNKWKQVSKQLESVRLKFEQAGLICE